MFTGIVQHVGLVKSVEAASAGRQIAIDIGPLADGLRAGDSVAVAGACLTATVISGSVVSFDVMAETISLTLLSEIKVSDRVNLERALTMSGGLDGHLVQGHVDGIGRVKSIARSGQHVITITVDQSLADTIVSKGSVAIDGVSLTIVEVRGREFSVAIIPTTSDATTLGALAVGSMVNIETDIIGKYVKKYITGLVSTSSPSELTMDKLKDAGFL